MLSPTVQEALPSSMYVYPVQKGTPLPDGWVQRERERLWRLGPRGARVKYPNPNPRVELHSTAYAS